MPGVHPVTLAEFILARVAEDEVGWQVAATAQRQFGKGHARQHLAQCRATRHIVEGCVESQYRWILQEVAAIWSDHPDYREEWKA
jgi:hypothetical protein